MRLMTECRVRNAIFAAVFLSAVGCTSMSPPAAAPRVEITGLSLIETSDAGQRFIVSLALENPNGEPLVFRSVEFRIRLSGEGFIDGVSRAPILLQANGSETVRVDVRTEFVSSVSRLLAYQQGPGSTIPYSLEGELALDTRPPRFISFTSNGSTPLIVPARQ